MSTRVIPAHNFVRGYPAWETEAIVTAGSEHADYPASNLTRLPLSYPWWSGGLSIADCTLTLILPERRLIELVTFGPHNCTPLSTYEVDVFEEPTDTLPLWTSGSLRIVPKTLTEDQVDYDGGRWWDRTFTLAELRRLRPVRPLLVPGRISARKVVIRLNDQDNPDGCLKICYIQVSAAYRAAVNFSYGSRMGVSSRTEMQQADGGTRYRRRRPKGRTLELDVKAMPRADSRGRERDMQDQCDTDTVFLVWPNPTDALNTVREAFFGTFEELDPITVISCNHDSVTMRIVEEL